MIAAPCSAEPVSSIRQYTRYKVLDGLQSMPGGEDVDNPDMLLAAQAVSRKPGGVAAAVAAVEWSPVLYCYFRRWLTSEGAEAVAAFLEDIVQYGSIHSPPSRLKWARAIIASVESERACSPVLVSLTALAFPAVPGVDWIPPIPDAYVWSMIRTELGLATLSSQLQFSVPTGVAAPHLSDTLFAPLLASIAAAMVATYLPHFVQSPHAMAYEMFLLRIASNLPVPRAPVAHLAAAVGGAFSGLTSAGRGPDDSLGAAFATPPARAASKSMGSRHAVAPAVMSHREILEAARSREINLSAFARLGVIGQGSYGSVYVWRHKLTSQLFSVKVCEKSILKSKSSVHTAIRELSCSVALDSTWCEGYAWVMCDSLRIYLAQRFVERGDLERWLLGSPMRRFEENVVCFYAAQIILALRALHSNGIVHRDLKASNVLVDACGYLTLTDFGLSVFTHRCSQSDADHARVCAGEPPVSTDICCRGCQQVKKLNALNKLTSEAEAAGHSAAVAGAVSAEAYRVSALAALVGSPGGSASFAGVRGAGPTGAGAMPSSVVKPASGAAAAQTAATAPPTPAAVSTSLTFASPATPATRRSIFGGLMRRSSPAAGFGHHAVAQHDGEGASPGAPFAMTLAAPPPHSTPMDVDAPQAQSPPSTDASGGSSFAIYDAISYPQWPGSAPGAAGALAMMRARCALHSRLLRVGYANPVILVCTDCTCEAARHDDGRGWYKGRAGTAAYWCPQMITRDRNNERVPYGVEADWWSLGCLVYALMTGRSPFSTGQGTQADNALTLDGRLIFSRSTAFSPAAKDFITLLCTTDARKRLGAGPEGWRNVMAHPFFKAIDWDLLTERVLPSPSIPTYKIALDWSVVPEKIEGQFSGIAAEEQRVIDEAAREAASKVTLTAEDEAIFRGCCFSSPDWLPRALLKTASQGHALPPLEKEVDV